MNLTHAHITADTSEPVLDTTVGDLLRQAALESPDGLALVEGAADPSARRRWTFGELHEQAEQAARALLGRFDPGEHVAVWAPNLPEWVLLQLGAGLAGVVLVPLNPAYRARELTYALGQSKAAGIFFVPEFRGTPMADWVEEAKKLTPELRNTIPFDQWSDFCASASPRERLPEVSASNAAQVEYTSGTTGAPKGALLHHRGITNNARLVTRGLGVEPGDVWLNPLPLFHVAGCVIGVLGALASRATLVQPLLFDPGLALELCESEKVTAFGTVPTTLIAMMEHPDFANRDLSSLRAVGAGGASVPSALVRRIESALGLQFSVLFGQTEASCTITMTQLNDSADDKAETVGLPLPQTEVCIMVPATGAIAAPGEVGGSGGSNLDYAILCEELAYGSAGIALGIYVHVALACAALDAFGGESLKTKWLPSALRGEKIGAWAFAEAGAGSDAGAVATRALNDGDSYVLNGSKLFITNGPIADFLVVVASTAPGQRLKGLSLFLVESDRPGFRVARSLSKLGVRASEMAELVFEDCRVPQENLIGREHRGFLDALHTLTLGRIASAAFATGVARAAFEATLAHAGERVQFGQPIGSFQAVCFGIADMAVQIEAARLLCHRAAIAADRGLSHGREASMAKLYATEACTKIVERALHYNGAAGFMSESPIQRFYRDSKVFELGEGSSELQRDMIARELGL